MEALHRMVGTEGDDGQRGVPRVVGSRRYHALVLEVDEEQFAVVHYHGAGMLEAHVEHHVLRSIVLVRMAVDALTLQSFGDLPVVVDSRFLEVREVALADGEFIIPHKAWRQDAV